MKSYKEKYEEQLVLNKQLLEQNLALLQRLKERDKLYVVWYNWNPYESKSLDCIFGDEQAAKDCVNKRSSKYEIEELEFDEKTKTYN